MLTLLQTTINHLLNLDPDSKKRLERLKEKTITINLQGINYIFQINFENMQINFNTRDFAAPDLTIKSTPLTLMRLAKTKNNRQEFFSKDVILEGDVNLAEQLINLVEHLEIDWEEYASQWIGDFPSHQLTKFISRLKRIGDYTFKTLLENTNEYVHEELNLAPTLESLQEFFIEVDELRLDVDRMDARIQQLKRKVG